MGQRQTERSGAEVTVENVGGISDAQVVLDAGVTVLAGRNATNRTSFLQAMMAVLGSENVSLKADADRGRVELATDGETYTRTLERGPNGVRFGGSPYLDDPESADLFAFLLESNEARQAVVRGDDLRDVLMRPVDTEAIRAEIARLEAEKRSVDDELDELDDLSEQLPALEEERRRLEERIDDVDDELDRARERLDAEEGNVQQSRAERDALDEKLDELSETRSELESVRFDLETQRESLESLREDRSRVESELEDAERPSEDGDELEAELERLRERRGRLDSVVTQLQSIIQFNEEMLDGTSHEVVAALRDEDSTDAVTDQLLPGDEVVCWTCGSAVDHARIEDTLERLQELRKEKVAERRSLREDIRERSEKLDELETRRREYRERKRRLANAEDEIETREEAIADLEARRDDLQSRIERLESEIADLEESAYDEVLEQHREVNELEFERDRLESERHEVVTEIREVENRLDDRESLATQRETVQEKLVDQRTRIERIEQTAVDQFNEHMADVLSLLGYRNIERIWIERISRSAGGRGRDESTAFELHVVRSSESGSAYEDTVDHLSESEREVTGLVFALAGFLTHEVYETVPFLLMDSLEALDSERIADLVAYVERFADNLVVALLPEDAAALDDEYHRVTEI